MSEFVVGLRMYLAGEVRRMMKEQTLTAKQVAAAMHWTESRLSRVLTGHRSLNWTEAKVLFEYLGVRNDEAEVLLDIVVRAESRRVFGGYVNDIGDIDVTFYEALISAPTSDHMSGPMLPYMLCPDDVVDRVLAMGFPRPEDHAERDSLAAVIKASNRALRESERKITIVVGEEAITRASTEHLEYLLANDWGWDVYVLTLDKGMPAGYLGRYSLLSFTDPAPMDLLAHHLPNWHVKAPIVRDEEIISLIRKNYVDLQDWCVPAGSFKAYLRRRLVA